MNNYANMTIYTLTALIKFHFLDESCYLPDMLFLTIYKRAIIRIYFKKGYAFLSFLILQVSQHIFSYFLQVESGLPAPVSPGS